MKTNYVDIVAWLLCFCFILAGSIVSVNRFWQYDVFYYDFGIFDSAICKVAHFQKPIIDHLVIGGKWIFADHFSPGIFLFSPLYWFTDKSESLLIAQAVVVGLSGIILYSIGKIILKNRFFSLVILISYYLFIGLQNAVISDFHETTVMTLPLVLVFWAIAINRKYLTLIFFLLMLSFKESTFLIGIGIAIVIFFLQRSWRKFVLSLFVISVFWGIVTIKIIIPYFSGDGYHYTEHFLDNPAHFATFLFDNPLKRNTLFFSFASFGFLPLFSPPFWPVIFQDFFTRFFPEWTTRWTLGLHYSASLAVINGVASIYGIAFLRKKVSENIINSYCMLTLISVIILYRFILHGPFALAYNSAFYLHTKNFAFLDQLVDKIPKNVSVMTQNNIAAHFTHQNVFLLRGDPFVYLPDYILIDFREGQNPNNFFGATAPEETVKKIERKPDYKLLYKTEYQYLFKKQ